MVSIIKVLITSSFLLFCSQAAFSDWGANTFDETKARPDKGWVDKFKNAKVIWTKNYLNDPSGAINAAIRACDDEGRGQQYCVVNVTPGKYTSFSVNRSKTKVVGVGSKKPRIKDDGFAYIYIENEGGSLLKEIIVENISLIGRNFGIKPFVGILIDGKNIQKVLIKDNTANGLIAKYNYSGEYYDAYDYTSIGDGHIIKVAGRGITEQSAIQNVTISGNIIKNTKTANSENITIAGNVKKWEVSNNILENISNIAIDAIGGERQSKNRDLDAARYGIIENNKIINMVVPPFDIPDEQWRGFPHVQPKYFGVSAIYIDGGNNILLRNNTVDNSLTSTTVYQDNPKTSKNENKYNYSFGYTIGAENCVVTHNITFINNNSINVANAMGDLSIGGFGQTGYVYSEGKGWSLNSNGDGHYSEGYDVNGDYKGRCATDDNGRGSVTKITVKNNTFTRPIELMYRITHAIIQDVPEVNAGPGSNGSIPENQNPNSNAMRRP